MNPAKVHHFALSLAAPAGRLARSPAPAGQNRFPVCVHCRSTKSFGDDRWAVHYYAPIRGHELVTRRDLFPSEPDHPRAGQWYYQLQLGPLEHKLPPIVAHRWRRVTFIATTGDALWGQSRSTISSRKKARLAVCKI